MKPEPGRNFRVAEVVQASAMDCGPAALAALLRSHGIAADCGRLREACQTDVDGTSIDVIEEMLNRMGLEAEQVILPRDRLLTTLPAIAVTRLPDGAPHFVLVWRKIGPFIQIMDPAQGRGWTTAGQLLPRLLHHQMSVPAADWHLWAKSAENLAPLRAALALLRQSHLLDEVLAAPLWYPLAALEACLRLTEALKADGVLKGLAAGRFLCAVLAETLTAEDDIYRLVPPNFWSVAPDQDSPTERRLILSGAVLIRTGARQAASADLSAELTAALRPEPVLPVLIRALRQAGAQPLLLCLGTLIALLGTLAEAVLLRVVLTPQGGALVWAIPALMLALIGLQLGLGAQTLRSGRRLEMRLRLALLRKLPRLSDRYHASRPLADMAERAQSLHLTRILPGLALHLFQAAAELCLVAAGLILLAPQALVLVLLAAGAAFALPFALPPLLAEAELAQRARGAAVAGVMVDAMRGQAPLRAHRAEGALRRLHESLLAQWLSGARRVSDMAALVSALRQAVVLGLIAVLILGQIRVQPQIDLLFLWWALKLPDAGAELAGLVRQIPAQRALLSRLTEPLTAAEPALAANSPQDPPDAPLAMTPHLFPLAPGPLSIAFKGAHVLAAGHEVLRDISLSIASGEHVAVVGPSGSGKSSLVGVLLGWHRLASGTLTLNGAATSEAGLAALRPRIAWVDPAVQLWSGSLRDNLAFATPDAREPALVQAADRAGLGPLLSRLPKNLSDALSAQIGAAGALLSGGEGQRLRLARAFLQADTRLAILDEPFRGLDRPSRQSLLAAARAHWRDSTLIWVTHDLAEVMDFPRVLVLDQGRIVEDGAPAELRLRPSRFAALCEAEVALKSGLWGAQAWRKLWLEAGNVRDLV